MPSQTLTPERILEATEDVLRRYGPAKATVVDVARVLGVSHGSVYRHFRTKAELREAVTQRWLEQAHSTLEAIVTADGPAPDRLARWLDELFAAKRRKAGTDPELFATYLVLVAEHSGTVARHIEEMVGQIAAIVADGLDRGEFVLPTPEARADTEVPTAAPTAAPATVPAAARSVWDAMSRFHDPTYAAGWFEPGIDTAYATCRALVLRGLTRA
jgi:AcrR family transcriptional regulator